jgi:ribosomal protein S18 acetylase RimI-like enzyme
MELQNGLDIVDSLPFESRHPLQNMISFRELEPSDMEAVFDVRVKTWHNPNGAAELHHMGITPESVVASMRSSHRGWVAQDGNRVVGFTMGNRQTGEMWVIAVLPDYENRGIGRRLLSLVEDWLCAAGWQEIWLTTDTDDGFRAVGFYRRLGWCDWKFEDGNRFMRKQLKPPAGHSLPLK